MKQTLELGARGSVGAGLLQSATHLAGDLDLADDDGLEAARHGEQVLGHAVAVHEGEVVAQNIGVESAAGADCLDGGVHGGKRRHAVGLVQIEVGLEPVAGRDDDGAAERPVLLHHSSGRRPPAHRQFLQHIEGGVFVTGGKKNEH